MVIRDFVASQADHAGFMIGGVKHTWKTSLVCHKSSIVEITRFLGGHFWPKFCGEGHKNIVDWGVVRVGVELLQISKLFSIWFKL